ncbi:MAG TPA: hypothetical protein VK638_25425 [Edaphobacter sp.]|nr:hypothetical protein [Edaphobacter sp.]
MADNPYWDGRIYEGAKFEEISIHGAVKEDLKKLQGHGIRGREAGAVAEIEAARNARLPWPIRTVGSVLDLVFRRPSV